MTTATIKKIKDEVKAELIEEFINPLLQDLKDPQGEYRPEFVADLLRALHEPKPYSYNAETLNKLI